MGVVGHQDKLCLLKILGPSSQSQQDSLETSMLETSQQLLHVLVKLGLMQISSSVLASPKSKMLTGKVREGWQFGLEDTCLTAWLDCRKWTEDSCVSTSNIWNLQICHENLNTLCEERLTERDCPDQE